MTKNRFIFSSYLILLSLWWGWTVLTDFIVIPTVFSQIDVFFKAGETGIAVFSQLNNLEIIVSTALIVLLCIQTLKNKYALKFLIMGIILWIISITYFAYLTPKIIELTALWKQADLIGLTSLKGIPDIQQEHHFFHNLYIWLDVVKLTTISMMIFWGVFDEARWS